MTTAGSACSSFSLKERSVGRASQTRAKQVQRLQGERSLAVLEKLQQAAMRGEAGVSQGKVCRVLYDLVRSLDFILCRSKPLHVFEWSRDVHLYF